MGLTPLTITGISQFSSDLQSVLTRAVSIAQIPVKALQNQDANILQKQTLLGSLNGAVSALAGSLSSLGTTATNMALSATSSNPAVILATNSGATSPASYTVNSITSIAAAASERTSSSYATATSTSVSATGTMALVVGSQNYTFTLASNNLNALRDKINSLNAGVTAAVLTTSATTNYLSITANSTGATTLQLFDNPTGTNNNVLTATNQGTNAVFQLNGVSVSQSSNVVSSVVPGLTFTLLAASASPVTLSLATDRTQLSNALQSLVTNYNALATQLSAQHGAAAGLLVGDTVVAQLGNALRQLTGYRTATGTVRSLADLGISLSRTGQMSLDTTVYGALSDTQIQDGLTFLGSATTGIGGLSSTFTQFSDPISGLIHVEQSGLSRTDQNLQSQISALNDRITVMQKGLAAKLQKADALLAQLQTQQTVLNANIQSLNAMLYGPSASQSSSGH